MALERNTENIHNTAGKVNACEICSEGMKKQHKKHQAGFLGCYAVEPYPNQITASTGEDRGKSCMTG